ncbi:3-dehydroquinate dehydratase [Lentilactobacillus hilgardii]|uniref:type I 3-dehydroquinate dehydratase n=1 Tax=Lentilactobacillus hilgardii TaxID=1588 RepID=UPI00019C49F0|nr:type I 3-dehydroquinate dehydratase [Lentilactobacillus hilgardii]EEI20196.1 3-dehydroquinate dehydratase, type I [Lentilactobacillus buchneri ATCC 11577]MCT3396308.1 type I 3-dehydroquinate dehydratase [Lentilactobacillus hilgardii]QIR08684.1 3-dehydroquinate dehydratase [Lentilactobacillus hilgardii]
MTSKIVNLRNIKLGSGQPKIAVPITGVDHDEIISQAKTITKKQPDVIEWRIDFFKNVTNHEALTKTGNDLRKILGNIALLTTFRTKDEGGELSLDDKTYFKICKNVISGGYTDAIDIERFHEERQVKEVVQDAHSKDVVIIMSNHDFDKTPTKDDIINRLTSMVELGADVAKMAVMPTNVNDLLTLLSATHQASSLLEQPIITMSMGDIGKVSRISGEVFGSCLTFGTVGAASAPGQISLTRLREDIEDLKLN